MSVAETKPPPAQIAATPMPAPRRRSSWTSVTSVRGFRHRWPPICALC